MNVQHPEAGVPAIAAAIGEPSRARMLYCLMDGRARTSTELAVVADVSASTASLHLAKLKAAELVTAVVQGKHRYYTLKGQGVAAALEALNVLAGHPRRAISLPPASRLRTARTCYDHMAGAIAVALHDRFQALGWLAPLDANGYMLTAAGAKAFHGLGVDVEAAQSLRRRFAFACLDWSERRPHLGGALGAAVLTLALRKKWIVRDLDSRVVSVTAVGRRDLLARLGIP